MNLRLLLLAPVALLAAGASFFALDATSTPSSAERTYVGQQTCMTSGCHADAYSPSSDYQGAAAFKHTFHQKIHLRPTPETVVIDRLFREDTVLKAYIADVAIPGLDTMLIRLKKGATDNDYQIQLKMIDSVGGFYKGDSTPWMPVDYTYGGNGWMQRYLVRVNGKRYIAPFQYVFPAYGDRVDNSGKFYYLDIARWGAFDKESGLFKFYDFDSASFLNNSWDKNCAYCHINGFQMTSRVHNGDTIKAAIWSGVLEGDSAIIDQNITVGCESCHGPGSEHVANPTKDNIVSPGQFPSDSMGILLKNDLCGQCHYRVNSTQRQFSYPFKDETNEGYMPGEYIDGYVLDRFSPGMNTWVDGITSYAHHQTGQDLERAKPFQHGVWKDACWSCHTVHTKSDTLPYQLNRDWYTMEDGKGCLECHGSHPPAPYDTLQDLTRDTTFNGRVVNAHTMHSQEVSQCVNCHFTKTATIGFFEPEFSSHAFKIFPPTLTMDYKSSLTGMLNTCASECHRNGRGNRNRVEGQWPHGLPAAPDFGITDNDINRQLWKDPADIQLADTLWYWYKIMYPHASGVGAVRENSNATGLEITSVAPNPMRGQTRVEFMLDRPSEIDLNVYDMRGRIVNRLSSGQHAAGTFSATWDGTDELGGRVASGTYWVRLQVGNRTISKRVIVER